MFRAAHCISCFEINGTYCLALDLGIKPILDSFVLVFLGLCFIPSCPIVVWLNEEIQIKDEFNP